VTSDKNPLVTVYDLRFTPFMGIPEDELGRIEQSGMPSPASVTVSRAAGTFDVTWSDGHVSRFRQDDLRAQCDCARCNAERESAPNIGRRELRVLGKAGRAEITSVKHAGRYGLDISWRDGHHSIFSYQYLYSICPCPECAALRPLSDPES
jgi:DUF971 family protein